MDMVSDILPILMALLAFAIVFMMILRRRGRYSARNRKTTDQAAIVQVERPSSSSSRSGVIFSEELSKQEVKLYDRAREIMGQLDSKIRVLEQLTLRSEQQIERLESLLKQSEKESQRGSSGSNE